MTQTPEELKASRHAAYLRRKVEGYYAKEPEPVTGTMGAIEAPDKMESIAPNLREKYLLALLRRDAVIWRQYRSANDHAMAQDDAMSPEQASRPTPHSIGKTFQGQPCRKCGSTERYINTKDCAACDRTRAAQHFHNNKGTKLTPHTVRQAEPRSLSEAEKEKRRAAWTPERREAQRQRTANDGDRGGDHGGRKVGRPIYSKSEARAAAKAAGEKRFIREQPCAKCGARIFLVSNGGCVACDKERARTRASRNGGRASGAVNPSIPRLAQFNRRPSVSGSGRGQSIPQAKDRQYATR
jgi:ribosomal protein L37E